LVIALIPAFAICKRIGKTRWWSAFCAIPGIGPIIFLFVIAYSRWPKNSN